MKTRVFLLFLISLMSARMAYAADIVLVQVADYSASRAALGKAMRTGAQMVFSKANADGSLGANKIKFLTFDDQYKPEETVRILEKVLVENKPALVVGVLGTANAGAVLKGGILERFQTTLVAPYTGADSLRVPVNPWVFHIRASYAEEVERIVQHYAAFGLKRIAVFHENDAFGKFIYASFQQSIAKHEMQEAVDLVIERGSTDMANVVERLRKADPQGIVIGTAGAPTAGFLKAIGGANLRAFRYGLSVNDVPSIVTTAGLENAAGFGQVQVMPDPTSGCGLKVCQEFNAAYKKYGDQSVSPSPSMMEGYMAARLAIEALRRIKGNIDNKSAYAALNGIGEVDLGGFRLNYARDQRTGSKYMDLGIVNKRGGMMY
jgi:branched-chain amino acid transport system substrate-binding protein